MTTWHVSDTDLQRYAGRDLSPPVLWSVEAHLTACGRCRAALNSVAGGKFLRDRWAHLDSELDAPVPGLAERVLLRAGVPEHIARLLMATPVLRASWLMAVAVTLFLTITLANLADPLVFLAVAPLLPLAGVAVCFGRGVDPTYEIAMVAPMHMFHLLLLRTTVVLTTTSALSAVASLGIPGYGIRALGWFLPALALTLLSLVLTPRLGPVTAVLTASLVWGGALAATIRPETGASILFAAGGQLAAAAVGATAAAALVKLSPAFDGPAFRRSQPRGARAL